MKTIYNTFIALVEKLLPVSKLFSSKMRLFVDGRKNTFNYLTTNVSTDDRIIWLHAASLGEYEQGVPILKELRTGYPEHKILITFFSPSGYEVKKDNEFASLTVYLPLDTRRNAQKFIDIVSPELALFVKYEVWPNYLKTLKEQQIPALLISGSFRPDQIYFKAYGGFFKKALHYFDYLFVQNSSSKNLLNDRGFKNVTISGDTRFDRVSSQLKMNNQLDFVETFKAGKCCLVCGSTWPEDEGLLIDFLNTYTQDIKVIIAPHQIKTQQINQFKQKLIKPSILYTEIEKKSIKDCAVLIVDTVGLLTKIYAYADIAYVGGAAGKTGLHNILEPAAFGLPIITGKNIKNFPEARELKKQQGLFSVKTTPECTQLLQQLVEDEKFKEKAGQCSRQFIQTHQGATKMIMRFIKNQYIF